MNGQEKVPPEVSEEDKAYYRSLPVVPDMEHEPVSVIHQISDAKGLGKMATPGPVPPGSEAAIHWIQSTPEV